MGDRVTVTTEGELLRWPRDPVNRAGGFPGGRTRHLLLQHLVLLLQIHHLYNNKKWKMEVAISQRERIGKFGNWELKIGKLKRKPSSEV